MALLDVMERPSSRHSVGDLSDPRRRSGRAGWRDELVSRTAAGLRDDLRVGVAFVPIDAFGAALVVVDHFRVIHAEEEEDRGVEIVDVKRVLHRIKTEVVRGADALAAA